MHRRVAMSAGPTRGQQQLGPPEDGDRMSMPELHALVAAGREALRTKEPAPVAEEASRPEEKEETPTEEAPPRIDADDAVYAMAERMGNEFMCVYGELVGEVDFAVAGVVKAALLPLARKLMFGGHDKEIQTALLEAEDLINARTNPS